MVGTRHMGSGGPFALFVRGMLALVLGLGLLGACAAPAYAGTGKAEVLTAAKKKTDSADKSGSSKKGDKDKSGSKGDKSAKQYKARFVISDSFSSKDYKVPATLKDYIARYGKEQVKTVGYTRECKLPDSDLTVTYLEDENAAPMSVAGPLHRLVTGIGKNETVSFTDFAKKLMSGKGSFDLSDLDKEEKFAYHWGPNMLFLGHGIDSTKDLKTYTGGAGVLFVEEAGPYSLATTPLRCLWVDVENGKISGKTQASLLAGLE